ncbi:MAG: CHAT domain-containing protein [Chloroflexi bacterium]|nr:CHAT domain-containing protein [Chloroflexota bacterium]
MIGRYAQVVSLEEQASGAAQAGRVDDALLAHGQALQIAAEMERPRLMAVILMRMGLTLEAARRVQDAVIAYESGLRALDADPGLDLSDVLMRLGAVHKGYDPGQIETTDLYQPAAGSELMEAAADPLLAVRLLIHTGNAYLQQPQEGPALNAYNLALERPEIDQSPQLKAYALANRGAILRRRGEIDAASAALDQAVALFDAQGENTEKRRALALLAGIARDRRLADQSEALYRQALTLYETAGDMKGAGRTYAGLGHLYLQAQDHARAHPAYEKALALARQSGDEQILAEVYWGLGRCRLAEMDLEGAASAFRSSLERVDSRQRELRTDEGKVSFLESLQRVYEEYIGVLLLLGEKDPVRHAQALQAAEEARGRALRDLMEGRERRRPHPAPEGTQIDSSSPFLTAEMAAGLESDPGFPMMAQMAPGLPSDPRRQMAAGIPSEPVDAGPQPAVRQTPPEPLPRLVFHVIPNFTGVFLVSASGEVHGWRAAPGAAALAEQIGRLRQELGIWPGRGVRHLAGWPAADAPPGQGDPLPLLRSLYQTLIAPVEAHLPPEGSTLVIEPHGPLWLLPFAALQDADGRWLGDRFPLVYAPSADTLEEIRGEARYGAPGELAALILGNPELPAVTGFDGLEVELEPLPGAEQEARQIAALFPEERRTLLLGAQASREALLANAHRAGILHLATHGMASAADPLSSFVVLAEADGGSGLLTARDAASLDLPAELVTLSACQTGLGRISGEGMLGLSRSFLAAGARSVLVSQWNVSDEATAALMVAFYQAYLNGVDKARALQGAAQALHSTPGWEHPRFWAPFVLVGAED